jgi:hypothetical protein
MTCPSPKNVIVVMRATERFAQRCESIPLIREHRPEKGPEKSLSGVTLRDLIEREGEGS